MAKQQNNKQNSSRQQSPQKPTARQGQGKGQEQEQTRGTKESVNRSAEMDTETSSAGRSQGDGFPKGRTGDQRTIASGDSFEDEIEDTDHGKSRSQARHRDLDID
jgi:hypothetical protein